MPLLKLSCANCSAPLEVGDNLERFTCSYCGTAQVVERSGGVISTRKLETAINAVQRGTDRTAAELAMPRLNNELREAMAERAALVQLASKRVEVARSSRRWVTVIAFLCASIGGLALLGLVDAKGTVTSVLMPLLWWVGIVAAPVIAFKSVKMPAANTRAESSQLDAKIARIEAHIEANRRILDALPA